MGNSFLSQAKAGNLAKVKSYLDSNCNIETRNMGGNTALNLAAEFGHLPVVTLLVAKGANINAVNEFGLTALMLAAKNDHPKVVKFLLDKGADIKLVDMSGRSISIIAVKGLSKELVKVAVDAAKERTSAGISRCTSIPVSVGSSSAMSLQSQSRNQRVRREPVVKASPFREANRASPVSNLTTVTFCTPAPSRRASLMDGPPVLSRQSSLLEIQRDELIIMGKLCSGGFSTVYRGEWRYTSIAVKVLRCAIGDKAYASLQTELAVLSQLRHPRILTLMGVCRDLHTADGSVGLLMELMERGSLYSILHSNFASPFAPTSTIERLRLALDIADGMRFLHHSGVVHRDLKSGNVLVSGDGRAKIADFGLSSYHQQAQTHVTNVMGTPAWSSPEVIRGEGAITASADVFSFGVILWELLTGLSPWEGKTTVQIIFMSMQGTNLSLNHTVRTDSPDVAYMMDRCFLGATSRPKFSELYKEVSILLTEAVAVTVAPNVYVPDSFICCIGYEMMTDPVICADGHSYERTNIEQWLEQSDRSPKTNLVLAHKNLIPNYALKELIEDANLR